MLLGHDAKGTTVMKDAIWEAIFGESAPSNSEGTSDAESELGA